MINITGNGMIGMKGFSGRLFNALARYEVNVILITQASSEHSISFVVSFDDEKKAKTAIYEEFDFENGLPINQKNFMELAKELEYQTFFYTNGENTFVSDLFTKYVSKNEKI